ncbi:vicilin-like seed storage protein At2g18540 isoform X4 [Penaeus japonicus]|uniref:vicilin-like seed storage protein At2g18540 isoform X4 n=1 Tax=Penaeus japonicus TaxID=27405 RepID=UPI001C712558|nr:vicilin-like seed storage protein At2g18540 isoform X4 [Penaeus japonicus]
MLERKFISFVFLSTYDTSSILIQKQREREISVKNSETVNLQKETRDLKEDLRKKEEEIVLLKDMQEEQGRERSRMETEVTNLHAENSEMKDILCLKEREIRELKEQHTADVGNATNRSEGEDAKRERKRVNERKNRHSGDRRRLHVISLAPFAHRIVWKKEPGRFGS